MDPKDEHREAAARALREVVLLRRAALQKAMTQQAAAPGPSSGSGPGPGAVSLADLPEFVMAYAVYLLAHHPDCPQVRACTAPCPFHMPVLCTALGSRGVKRMEGARSDGLPCMRTGGCRDVLGASGGSRARAER